MQTTFAKVARRFSGYLTSNAPLSNRSIKLSLANYRFVSDTVPRVYIPNKAHLLSEGIHFTSRRLCGTAAAMSDTGELREFLNQEDARELDNSLFFEYKFPVEQCLELAGLSVAQAVVRCYPLQDLGVESPRILICCGPGNNGGDGLVAAKHLFFFVRLSMCLCLCVCVCEGGGVFLVKDGRQSRSQTTFFAHPLGKMGLVNCLFHFHSNVPEL